jgi:hypothetical protein
MSSSLLRLDWPVVDWRLQRSSNGWRALMNGRCYTARFSGRITLWRKLPVSSAADAAKSFRLK